MHTLPNLAMSHAEKQRAGPAPGPATIDPFKASISCPIQLWLVKQAWGTSGLGISLGNRM